MKFPLFVLAITASAFALGCGSSVKSQQTKTPPGYAKGAPSPTAAPEAVITKLETTEDRAAYLAELGNDSTFDPKQHTAMLEKYAADADQEVASKARALLERAR